MVEQIQNARKPRLGYGRHIARAARATCGHFQLDPRGPGLEMAGDPKGPEGSWTLWVPGPVWLWTGTDKEGRSRRARGGEDDAPRPKRRSSAGLWVSVGIATRTFRSHVPRTTTREHRYAVTKTRHHYKHGNTRDLRYTYSPQCLASLIPVAALHLRRTTEQHGGRGWMRARLIVSSFHAGSLAPASETTGNPIRNEPSVRPIFACFPLPPHIQHHATHTLSPKALGARRPRMGPRM